MTIQLRYTSGSPWTIELVSPKKKEFKEQFDDTFGFQQSYMKCDWRHLLAYLLGDEEMKKHVRDTTKDNPRSKAMSWLFKITHSGAKDRPMYVSITDGGATFQTAVLNGQIGNSKIWCSIIAGVDFFLKEKVANTEPVEYELAVRYYNFGVAKRGSRENRLFCYTRERDSRKSYEGEVIVKEILI